MFAHALDTMQCLYHINIAPETPFGGTPWICKSCWANGVTSFSIGRTWVYVNMKYAKRSIQYHHESDVRHVNRYHLLAFGRGACYNICNCLPHEPFTRGGLTLHPLHIWEGK